MAVVDDLLLVIRVVGGAVVEVVAVNAAPVMATVATRKTIGIQKEE